MSGPETAMRVYFCGSIRGGRHYLPAHRLVVDTVHALGHTVLNAHIVADDPRAQFERMLCGGRMGDAEFDRACCTTLLDWLAHSDAVIAEVSGTSTGVGLELGVALASGTKPVLIVYDAAVGQAVSAMATGAEAAFGRRARVRPYSDRPELGRIVADFCQSHTPPAPSTGVTTQPQPPSEAPQSALGSNAGATAAYPVHTDHRQ